MQLVLNWHVTALCNYSCKYCFAKWEETGAIFRDSEKVKLLLSELDKITSKIIMGNNEIVSGCRINFVGGEPLLLKDRLKWLVDVAARDFGFSTSVVTNGALLEQNISIVDSISCLGVSVDSFSPEVIRRIGRCTSNGKMLLSDDLKRVVKLVRRRNSALKIKFNVVVNSNNWQEVVLEELAQLEPDRLKVFRQMPFGEERGVSDREFNVFLKRNLIPKLKVVIENNSDMTESYLMVDPAGRFFQNREEGGYVYSRPIHEVGIDAALGEIKFDVEKFVKRYGRGDNE